MQVREALYKLHGRSFAEGSNPQVFPQNISLLRP